MSFWNIAGSKEFAAALGGAGAAFLLEAMRRWWADNSKKQASINMALLSLSQMYTVLKNYHDQVFVDARPALEKELGHDPPPFYYKAAIGTGDQQLRIKYEELGSLLRSYDPDVLSRLLAAERCYLSGRALMDEHALLHREFQRRAAADPSTATASTIGAIKGIVGPDLYGQLEATVEGLQEGLPKDYATISTVGRQVREVARMQFPVRRFVGFNPIERTDVVDISVVGKPASWRMALRWIVDLVRKSMKEESVPLPWAGAAMKER